MVIDIIGQIETGASLSGTMNIPKGSEYPRYTGEYEATPSTQTQIFTTRYTVLSSDFTVNATPYSEVSNEQGGHTVTIL